MLTSTVKPRDRYFFSEVTNPLVECTIVADERNDKSDKIIANCIFQKANDANANGHRFSRKVLSKAVDMLQKDISERHFMGELDHPSDISDVGRIGTVELKEVSHLITKLQMDGDYVVGQFETLSTPHGIILASLLRDNCKIGVSVRAITDQDISYGMDNIDDIQDFTIITYDAVNNPAYADSYVSSIKNGSISASKSYNDYLNSIISSCYRISDNKYQAVEPNNQKITLTKKELTEIIEASIKATYKKKLY